MRLSITKASRGFRAFSLRPGVTAPVAALPLWNRLADGRIFGRGLSTAAAAPTVEKKADIMCFQCEQTREGTGCRVTGPGVCGKTPEVAAIQDVLVAVCKGISQYASRAAALGARDDEIDRYFIQAMFTTLTNVNFDDEALSRWVERGVALRDKAKAMYEKACAAKGVAAEAVSGPAKFTPASYEPAALVAAGAAFTVAGRQKEFGEDVAGLQEMAVYGLKGACAYAEHALVLGAEDAGAYAMMHDVMRAVAEGETDLDKLLGLSMRVGELNLTVMKMLDEAHGARFGTPSPHKVPLVPRPGKAILISGHDMMATYHVLQQTEGTGINVYTHGECLPAHSYPGLRAFPHLAGHFGGPWQLQKSEFARFPGAILMTTNCLMEPRKSYAKRIFTHSAAGWPGVGHISGMDFAPLIQAALNEKGFTDADSKAAPLGGVTHYDVGYGRHTVMSVADKVVDAVKSGAVKRFFVIGGCDGSEGERSYYTDLAKKLPKESLILTMGCAKYRINRLPLGDIGGIPRLLDMGQCNDAYGAAYVAIQLANAFKTDVNSLPLSLALSWLEQKAVAVLLTLLHLGIKNIRVGPALPAFVTPNVLKVLTDKFNLQRVDTNDVETDLARMLGGH